MLKQYQQLIKQQVLCEDKAQYTAVAALNELSKKLVLTNKQSHLKKSFYNKLTHLLVHQPLLHKYFDKKWLSPIKSVYLYGRVGRGKTMLMDLFYQNIAIKNKKRIHFHRFMEDVHQQLNALSIKQSKHTEFSGLNPLAYIAKSWSQNIELLCFDEFFVSDIGDAMLLSTLCKEFFSLGITLVFTSNCRPEELYRNGLQRDRFIPTIALINEYCRVISVNGDTDHRLINTEMQNYKSYENYYFTHLNGEQLLAQRFEVLRCIFNVDVNNDETKEIIINNRKIHYLAKSKKNIWFDFYDLCSGPRSQRDYIKIADEFDTVLISHVPQFMGDLVPAVFSGIEDSYQRSGILMASLRHLDDEARRFIALVDEFYDKKVQLVISADVDIMDLYKGQQLSFEFERCQSRLCEMQRY